MNLLNMLMGSMNTESSVNSLAQQSGASKKQVSMLMMIAIPILLKMMTKNASSQSGAQSLLGALSQHTSQKSMAQQIQNADQKDGEKIIGHILGEQSSSVISSLAQQTGMNSDQITSVLGSMAPALMSGVSAAATTASGQAAQKPKGGFDLSGVLGMFGGAAPSQQTQHAADGNDLLGSLLSLMK